MLKIILLKLLFLYSISLYAYIPPVESLFKNGSNPDLGSKHVTINLHIKEQHQLADVILLYKEATPLASSDVFKILVTFYDEKDSLRKKPLKVSYYPNFTSFISAHSASPEKQFFYASLTSLFLNKADFMLEILKKQKVPVDYNQNILNKEKETWLLDYKLALERNEKIAMNQGLFTQSMYKENPYTSIVLQQGDFYLQFKKDSINAFFTHEDHLLRELSLDDSFKFSFEQYRYIKGQKTPQFIKWQTAQKENAYLLEVMSVKYLEAVDNLFFIYDKRKKEMASFSNHTILETIF
ncbi:MAG: hypothetical protein KBD63_07565 [Bacteriovoracaceae bacterium]|nr:hypothetical protein [Bacteriovoracaceae bacterium]